MSAAATVADYRALARARIPRFLFDYIDGGAYDEVTLARNIDDLRDVTLKQQVLRDVSGIDLSTTLFDDQLALPVVLAPVGLTGAWARRGEVQAARAAQAAGAGFTLSTVGVCPIAEVARDAGPGFWFQLYVIRDRAFMRDIIGVAREAGCKALVLTVDLPVPGARYRDQRSGMSGGAGWARSMRRAWQAAFRPRWTWDVALRGRPLTLGNIAPVLRGKTGIEDFLAWAAANFDQSVTWNDLAEIRALWPGPLIVKGVLEPGDARAAISAGADGIVVSNHGGRQLDGVLSSARALPPIVDAVGDQAVVMVDGGVRSGLDVVRMLALGARGVMMGRAWAYALAAEGERGVARMLALTAAEMRVAMALTGVTRIADIDRSILVR